MFEDQITKGPRAEMKAGRVRIANNSVAGKIRGTGGLDEALLRVFLHCVLQPDTRQICPRQTPATVRTERRPPFFFIRSHAVQSFQYKREVQRLAPSISLAIAMRKSQRLCHDSSGHLG